jgi:hypothetical protein
MKARCCLDGKDDDDDDNDNDDDENLLSVGNRDGADIR